MRPLFLALLSLCAAVVLAGPAPGQKKNAYKKTYVSDMEAFTDEVTKSYPFFDLKDIRKDWSATKKDIEKRARKCKTDAEFIGLLSEGIAVLRDAHMQISENKVDWPEREPTYYTGISFLPATDGRVVVMHPPQGQGASLETGTLVLSIDGEDPRELLAERAQAAWEAGGSFSSPQRAELFEYRTALRGERGEKHVLVCLDGKKKKKVTLTCRTEIDGWPHTYNLPADLKSVGKSFYYSRLESGVGYMYLRRVDGSISQGIGEALEKEPDVQGWIVDLRGNSGGGYDDTLVDRVKAVPGPIAVITDAGCISAGETLVRDFVRYREARVLGTTTAGSSSSKRNWTLPSGMATIRISTRSRFGPDGEPIEFKGVAPHEVIEVVPEELAQGENSEILRAQAWVLSAGS